MFLMSISKVSIVASTRSGQFKSFDGEGEVVIIRIIHQKSMIDVLLEALCVVACRDQRTGLTSSCALLHPSCLGQCLVVSLDAIHDDPPLAGSVDGPQGGDVPCHAGAEVRLLAELHQPVHTVVGVGQDVLVKRGHSSIVILNCMRNLITWVISIINAP